LAVKPARSEKAVKQIMGMICFMLIAYHMPRSNEMPPSAESENARIKKALSFFSQRGTAIFNCSEAYLLTHGFAHDDLDEVWSGVGASPREEPDSYTFAALIRDLEANGFSDIANFVKQYVRSGYDEKNHQEFLKDHNIPEEVIKFTPSEVKTPEPTESTENPFEQPYEMNLSTNYGHVVKMLMEMEGEDWFKHQKTWEENSIDGALEAAKKGGGYSGGVIYGFGGWHRFFVRPNGDVVYSSSHGSSDVEKAKRLGFKID